MSSRTLVGRKEEHRRQVLAEIARAEARKARRRRLIVTGVAFVAVASVITVMMLTSRPSSSATARPASEFTLTDTTGRQVSLADYRGKSNVVLYFSEGAGCGSCLQQMTEIEKNQAAFDKLGVTVLPIVMNTREQITKDMTTYGTRTPFLLDDGTVSTAYKTIGHGMHAGLPGHSFVLIDKAGVQRWFGEYPSMWLAPTDLLRQVSKYLAG